MNERAFRSKAAAIMVNDKLFSIAAVYVLFGPHQYAVGMSLIYNFLTAKIKAQIDQKPQMNSHTTNNPGTY